MTINNVKIDISHEYFMRLALDYAKRGAGRTAENPSVGCVITRGEQVVSVGRTADRGRPHAEAIALAGLNVTADMVMYVTLEPCAHHGKTPPCVEAIINAGVRHVVIACLDDDARVSGAGVARLQQAGVLVEIGVLEAEANAHHRGFLRRVRAGLPTIMVKIATSLDEKITAPDRWITNQLSRNYGQLLRSHHDAIITGIGTIASDNPSLNCRLNGLQQYSPLRVVLDRGLRIELSAQIVQDSSGALILSSNNNMAKIAALRVHNVKVVLLESGFSFADTMLYLGERGINSVMVEGGQTITSSALNSGLADDLYWFKANKIIGNSGLNAINAGSLQDYVEAEPKQIWHFDDDILLHYCVSKK